MNDLSFLNYAAFLLLEKLHLMGNARSPVMWTSLVNILDPPVLRIPILGIPIPPGPTGEKVRKIS